ncbi:MAG: hypothetical protein REI94_03475 [Moraxellaceae bacterium]|nr:hypothetical protein [Moraxellaceae bacterium]
MQTRLIRLLATLIVLLPQLNIAAAAGLSTSDITGTYEGDFPDEDENALRPFLFTDTKLVLEPERRFSMQGICLLDFHLGVPGNASGQIHLRDDHIVLQPTSKEGCYRFEELRLYPVTVKGARFLLSVPELRRWLNAINADSKASFKATNSLGPKTSAARDTALGTEYLPASQHKYVLNPPVSLRITAIGPVTHLEEKRHPMQPPRPPTFYYEAEVTLDLGAEKGAFPGMSIYGPALVSRIGTVEANQSKSVIRWSRGEDQPTPGQEFYSSLSQVPVTARDGGSPSYAECVQIRKMKFVAIPVSTIPGAIRYLCIP